MKSTKGVIGKCLLGALLLSLAAGAQAQLVIESFGFGGRYWDFDYSAKIIKFNKAPIGGGYSFVRFRNPESGKQIHAFIINNGEYFTICNPNMDVVLPLLRNMAKAYHDKDEVKQVILESEVQKNLISTCAKSFTSVSELKRLFNEAAGYQQMPGLAYQ